MFTEGNVDLAKLLLVRIYACASSNQLLVKDIFYILKGSGVTRADLKEARKRLGIESQKTDTGQTWVWPEGVDAGEKLDELKTEFAERIRAREA